MDIFLYLDASGQSSDTRLWGALVIIGKENNHTLQDIIEKFCDNCENFQELKGKSLSSDSLKEIILTLQQQTAAYFYCKRHHKDSHKRQRDDFFLKLKSLWKKHHPLLQFYSSLKKVNQVKFICLLETIEKALCKLPKDINDTSINIYIDDENLPLENLQKMTNEYISAIWKNKNINTFPACDSKKIPGIQAIDLFLGYTRQTFPCCNHVFIDM